MDYLVIRLYAPLSSWGTLAVGEDRPTVSYPTRGAVLGLLGAALGIKRTDTQKLQDLSSSIEFGSKTYCTGTILRDYHTIQTPTSGKGVEFFTRKQELQSAKLETILSSRDYREDGLWVVAIWLKPDSERKGLTYHFDLEQLQSALLRPKFTLYIGRKSCPLSLPLSPKIISADSLKSALDMDIIKLDTGVNHANTDVDMDVDIDIDTNNNDDNIETHSKGSHNKTNELLENIVSDRWLPTTLVYRDFEALTDNIGNDTIDNQTDNDIDKGTDKGTDKSDLDAPMSQVKSQRLRQVTYHWEGSKSSLFAEDAKIKESNNADNPIDKSHPTNVYTHSHWDDPTNREQWQFRQRVGHEWTTLEAVAAKAIATTTTATSLQQRTP